MAAVGHHFGDMVDRLANGVAEQQILVPIRRHILGDMRCIIIEAKEIARTTHERRAERSALESDPPYKPGLVRPP